MRIAVAGSVATDHLLSFDGRFADAVLPEQLASLSVSFLASDLQVRRGGTGADIAFGLASLGLRPVLVAAVGHDAGDYLDWLSGHGVDLAGVTTSSTRATARFTCTTDLELCQIATFYPGAMVEAADIDLAALGPVDLVVIAPDDPGAMLRHTAHCRASGTAFAADPSQQLAFMPGEQIAELIEGATWLFSNEYEAGLIHSKTGWNADQVLARVGTRITTHGAKGVRVSRQGEPDLEIPAVPAHGELEPTGVGDAFRAGFLAGQAWGLGLERCAQLGALLASCVVETVGPQEYTVDPAALLSRFTTAYGEAAAAELHPHLQV